MSAPEVPTIEQIAIVLGEQYAHLAPYQTHVPDPRGGPSLVPAVWWAVWVWEEDELRRPMLAPVRWTDDDGHDHALAGPTREDALVAAGEAILAGRFDPVETCPGCNGSGSWETHVDDEPADVPTAADELPEDACPAARAWCASYATLQEAWDACPRGDWMGWYVRRRGVTAAAQRAIDTALSDAQRDYDTAISDAQRAYVEVTAPARRTYAEVTAMARRAYDEAAATARQVYADEVAAAQRAYDEVTASARRAYADGLASARRAYAEAIRRAVPVAP